jgi:hypothetical protein
MVVLPQLFLFDTSRLVSICFYFIFAGTLFLYCYYHQFVPFILCTLRVFVVVVFANQGVISGRPLTIQVTFPLVGTM